jgi:hypothetical protein
MVLVVQGYRVPIPYFMMMHYVLTGTQDDVRQVLLAAPLALPFSMRDW